VSHTWLQGLPEGETDWDRLAARWPEAADALAGLGTAPWEETDPMLLELCRLRMATLLRSPGELARRNDRARAAGLTEDRIAELPSWPTSSHFTARERACLSVAEQFVIDANGVTEAQIADVTHHLGAVGCYAFVQALSTLETFQRACLTLGVDPPPAFDRVEVAGPDATTREAP